MTIDNAISRFNSFATFFDGKVEKMSRGMGWANPAYVGYCAESAAECRQIVRWLEKVKEIEKDESNSAS